MNVDYDLLEQNAAITVSFLAQLDPDINRFLNVRIDEKNTPIHQDTLTLLNRTTLTNEEKTNIAKTIGVLTQTGALNEENFIARLKKDLEGTKEIPTMLNLIINQKIHDENNPEGKRDRIIRTLNHAKLHMDRRLFIDLRSDIMDMQKKAKAILPAPSPAN